MAIGHEQIHDMVSTLYSILNVEGAAKAGAMYVPAHKGLDTTAHFNEVRAAIKAYHDNAPGTKPFID